MALIKIKEFRGIECNYFAMIAYSVRKIGEMTQITLGLYKDKATRDKDPSNCLDQIQYGFEGIRTEADCFKEIKRSHIDTVVIAEAVPEIKDEQGNVTQEAKPAITKLVEQNFFADAIDDI